MSQDIRNTEERVATTKGLTLTVHSWIPAGDIRGVIPRFTADARQANQAVVDLVRRIADAKGATPAQVALGWLLTKQPWIVPIPGTRRLERLQENLAAADLELTPDDVADLDEASARIEVQGDRYPEQMQAMIDR